MRTLIWRLGAAMAALLAGTAPVLATGDKPAATVAGSIEHVHALAVDAAGRVLFLGTHSGLLRSEDGGRTWQAVGLPSKHPHVDVMAVTLHPEDARVIYVATHEAGVIKSTDGGKTWRETNTGLGGLDVHGLAIDPREPRKLHAAVRDKGEGIYRSTDGGEKWVRVDDGPGGEVKVLTSVMVVRDFAGDFGIGFPLWIDPGGRAPDAFGVRGHPNTILIDRGGKVVGRVLGERDWSTDDARRLVEWLLRAGQ